MGSVAFAILFEGAAHSSGIDRDEFGVSWRNHHRLIRCVFMESRTGRPSLNQILHGRMLFGNFLALVGAWMVAGYLMIGRKLRVKMSLMPYIFLVYGMAAVCLLIIVPVARESLFGYHWLTYVWILLLALVPQLIGHSTYNWALAYLSAALVAVMTLGEPIGSSVLAYFILKETPTLAILFGGVLILIGIYFATRGNKEK